MSQNNRVDVAQMEERRSPKPKVAGSSPAVHAKVPQGTEAISGSQSNGLGAVGTGPHAVPLDWSRTTA